MGTPTVVALVLAWPDGRYLLAHRGDVTVTAWTAGDLAAAIRRQTGAR